MGKDVDPKQWTQHQKDIAAQGAKATEALGRFAADLAPEDRELLDKIRQDEEWSRENGLLEDS